MCEDAAWASGTAVTIYQLLAALIDPEFSHPDPKMTDVTGAALLRRLVMLMCQVQFHQNMTDQEWSRGLIAYLGQTCTVGTFTSTTPIIALDVIDKMVLSKSLMENENFDILLGFFIRAGPFLDSTGHRDELTTRVHVLEERAKLLGTKEWLAVYGMLQLREKGWTMGEQDEGASNSPVKGDTGDGVLDGQMDNGVFGGAGFCSLLTKSCSSKSR